jgi:hypothetical protein
LVFFAALDPDPGQHLNADPDPGHGFAPSWKNAKDLLEIKIENNRDYILYILSVSHIFF